MVTIKRYTLTLTENVTEEIIDDSRYFGMNVIWVSKLMSNIMAVETNKTKEELEAFHLIESAEEEMEGTVFV